MRLDRPPRSTPYLVVRGGRDGERVVLWDTVEITVGRLDGQDIEVDDPEVSRRHCVFRHKEGRFGVEDLGSALGTRVGGEPIRAHALAPGDVVEVGTWRIEFGLTDRPPKPGGNVRFASQLKAFDALTDAAEAGGRTMMAIDLDDDPLARSAPTLVREAPRARAVSLDGSLEELDAPDPLGGDDLGLGAGPAVRDLDAALAELGGGLGPVGAPVAAAAAPRAGAAATVTVSLVLDVNGPPAQVEALVAALRGRRLDMAPLRMRVRDPRAKNGGGGRGR